MKEISIKIESVEVKAKPRKLGHVRVTEHRRGRKFVFTRMLTWSVEPIQPKETYYGLNVEDELTEQYMRFVK